MAFWTPTDSGANVWTNVTTSSWTYNKNDNSSNYVQWGTIDGPGGTISSTWYSTSGGQMTRFIITYDKDENWYTGSGTPASNQADARSLAAHEFGHGLRLGHTQASNCYPQVGLTSEATMCAGYFMGTTHYRTLANDDKNGVSAMYP